MSKAVAKVESTNVALADPNAMPDYMRAGGGRGNEDVKVSDMTMPRIKLLQKMSDEVDRHHTNYIEGAKDGDFLNSVTGEIYGDTLYVIPIKFKEEFTAWRDREKGGGFLGSFPTEAAAREAVAKAERPEEFKIVQGHAHILVLKDPKTGLLSKPVNMDFTSSKLRISRQWNTNINIRGGDRFTGVWKLTSVAAKNKTGAQFMNVDVSFVGWATQEDYKAAEAIYSQFAG
jgi:hypothetical protein